MADARRVEPAKRSILLRRMMVLHIVFSFGSLLVPPTIALILGFYPFGDQTNSTLTMISIYWLLSSLLHAGFARLAYMGSIPERNTKRLRNTGIWMTMVMLTVGVASPFVAQATGNPPEYFLALLSTFVILQLCLITMTELGKRMPKEPLTTP